MSRLPSPTHAGAQDELEDALYDLGVVLDEENIAAAQKGLGMTDAEDSTCDYAAFKKWWDGGYGKKKEIRAALLGELSSELGKTLLPEIKKLFAEADKDNSGTLDRAEFEVFYPIMREYLGYEIPPVVHCLNDMDADSGLNSQFSDGQIQYEEVRPPAPRAHPPPP